MITLHYFTVLEAERLKKFEAWWREKQQAYTEDFPMYMGREYWEENYRLWEEG